MIRLKFAAVQCAAAVMLLAAAPVMAQQAKDLGKSGDWEAYVYTEKGGKVCYAASLPKRSTGAPKDRKTAMVTVTFRTADKTADVFSYSAGLPLKKDSPVVADPGGKPFDLFTQGDTAWARDAASDKALADAMAKGKDLVIKAVPAKGTPVTDNFSLSGFGQARSRAAEACGMK